MRLPVLAAGLLAVVIWSIAPVATKTATADLPPIAVGLLRTVVGGLLALVLALALRLPLPADRRQWLLLAGAAGGGFIGFPLVFTIGQGFTSATHGALLLALMPLATGANVFLIERRPPERAWLAGSLVALAGTAVLIGSRPTVDEAPASFFGDALVLASTMLASAGYVFGGRLAASGYTSKAATFWGAGLAALALLPVALWVGAPSQAATMSIPAALSIAYLAVGVTLVSYLAWYWALAQGGVARVATLQFLQPITGVAAAMLLLGEPLRVEAIAAAGVIIAGVAMAGRK